MALSLPSWKQRRSILLMFAAVGIIAAQGSAARIPEVHGTSLTNETVNLPEVLQGKVAVLTIGFSRGSRAGVTGWAQRLAADYRESPNVMYYEMPMLAEVPGVLRGIVVRSLKSSVPQRAWRRVVPITNNEAAWRTLTHYVNPDDPYLLVVDGQGEVIWQTQGVPTDAAYAALKQKVEMSQPDAAK